MFATNEIVTAGHLTFKLTEQGFVSGDGNRVPFVCVESRDTSHDWMQKQDASMAEYLGELEAIPPSTRILYRLFDTYIAAALHGRRNAKILDVGCGLNRDWPQYVATLRRERTATGNLYMGLDPIAHDVEHRAYPFVCARLEDLPAVFADRFDAFLFATSLDHFEHLGHIADAVRQLAAEDAFCIFWVGLHEPSRVGEQIGARAYRRLFSSLAPLSFTCQYLRNLFSMPVNYARLLRRRSKLTRGRPLDHLHFHYFTEASLALCLRSFGTVVDTLHVPGTSSVFVTVRTRPPGGRHGDDVL